MKLEPELYFERERTTEIATTVANWRAHGHDPADLLTGKNTDDYGPRRYAVDENFDIDAPLIPNDRSNVRYVFKMVRNPFFFGYAEMGRGRYPTSHLSRSDGRGRTLYVSPTSTTGSKKRSSGN
jgi:hypothetical protein